MSYQGHNILSKLQLELEASMMKLINDGAMMYLLRRRVREIALSYRQFIIWSPELHRERAVVIVDIWDQQWNTIKRIEVTASEKILNAPLW